MQASDALAAMSLQLQQAAQQQLAAATAAIPGFGAGAGAATLPGAQTGVVRAWYDEKGFGFIAPDSGGQDVFIHRKQLGEGQSLVQGTPVQFELAMSSSSGKPAASRVTPLGAANPLLALAAATAAPAPTPALPSFSGGGASSFPSAGFGGGKGIGKGPAEPSDNLFICGLPLDTTEDRLKVVFNEYGTVTSMRMLPDVAGKPDKSALVRMADVSQASWMVDNLNGNIPQGLSAPITVRFADNRAQKARELGLPKPGTLGGGGFGAARGKGFGGDRSSPYGAAGAAGVGAGMAGALDPASAGLLGLDPASAGLLGLDPASAGLLGALDPASAGMAGAVDPQNAAVLLATLAQIQQQQNGIPPAPNPGQSLQELLQDLQNLQGLTGQQTGSPAGSLA